MPNILANFDYLRIGVLILGLPCFNPHLYAGFIALNRRDVNQGFFYRDEYISHVTPINSSKSITPLPLSWR